MSVGIIYLIVAIIAVALAVLRVVAAAHAELCICIGGDDRRVATGTNE